MQRLFVEIFSFLIIIKSLHSFCDRVVEIIVCKFVQQTRLSFSYFTIFLIKKISTLCLQKAENKACTSQRIETMEQFL